jgi:hypothetical protein
VRCFASALRRDIRYRAFQNLQQCLPNALAGDVAVIDGFSSFFAILSISLDVDDALLRFAHRHQQLAAAKRYFRRPG